MAHSGVADVCQELLYRTELPAVPASVKQARRQLNAVLESWAVPAAVASDAAFLLTEIFTNAVKFGAGPQPGDTRRVAMAFRYLAGELVLEVSDDSPSLPVLCEPGPDVEHGRGLQVVDKLSAQWGHIPLPRGGKTVYCTLHGVEGNATASVVGERGMVATVRAAPTVDDPRVEYLEKLGAELSSRGVRCSLVKSEVIPRLHIHVPWLMFGVEDAEFEDNVLAAEYPAGTWQFWWPWVEPIAPVGDITGAADLLAAELMLTHPETGGEI